MEILHLYDSLFRFVLQEMSSESLYQQGPKYFPCNILSTTQNSELYDSEAENAFFVQLLKLEAFKSHASNPFMLFLVVVAF